MTADESVLLEVCVGSLDDAVAAEDAGADRLELCGALELGGLTPSIGLVEQVVAAVRLPVVVMVRPRAAGFCYSASERACMTADAQRLLDSGAAGIVFGVLDCVGQIDRDATEQLVAVADGRDAVFHRAFDAVEPKAPALATLIECGVTRVLTSGAPGRAADHAERLGELNNAAAGRIEILAGGGVSAADIPALVNVGGCRQVHIGAATGRRDASVAPPESAALCDLQRLAAGEYRAVDGTRVGAVSSALDA